MFEALKNDVAGLAILKEWLGEDGTPVSTLQACARSVACVKCVKHRPAKWWEWAKNKVASAIKRHLSVKHRLGLVVDLEESLGMCQGCGCCVRLKIWTPLKHIEAHQTEEVWAKLAPDCWMIRERANK